MMEKVTFIYCFKDRDLERVKLSLDSLAAQKDQYFKVIFVDYGSEEHLASQVRQLTGNYPFVRHIYNDTRGMLWNRSHALNTGIRLSETEYVFTSDIDMIYDPGFTEMLNTTVEPDKALFFSAIYLPPGKLPGSAAQEKNYQRSKDDALGWGLIPLKPLMEIGGYDEVYCVWGKEDNDIGHRLRMAGVRFHYVEQIWMRHYYHEPVPRQRDILPFNWFLFLCNYYDHVAQQLKRNSDNEWGKIFSVEERRCINLVTQPNTAFIELKCRSRYFRFSLETMFHSAPSGTALTFSVTDTISDQYLHARLFKIGQKLTHLLQKLKIPLVLSTPYQYLFEDIYSFRDELFYFLVTNRKQIADYAFMITGKTLKVVLIKK